MESFDSSPNYTKATSSFDSKKEYSPGGSECADIISIASSTCGSSVNGPKLNKNGKNGIKHRTNKNKTIKNLGNVKSFCKRAKSRIISQSPVTISYEESLLDSSDPSPHYLKATSSSQQCKKMVYEDAAVTRATHSSSLKGSNFPDPVELRSGGAESEIKSAAKVCRYHHCSLHGHCHGTHGPVSQTKRFLYKRRRSLRKQKSIILKIESGPGGEKHNSDEYENIRELDFIEVAFGENSFPERSYQESLDISRKYSLFVEQEFGGKSPGPSGYRLRRSCHNEEQVTTQSTPAGDFKDKSNVTQVNDSETDSPPTQEGGKLERHFSMWHLIHQHMSTSSAVGPTNASVEGESPVDSENSEMGTTNNDSENRETQLRKMLAIKLVREAIEKILLPEVQDQTSDDQSVTSESTPPRTEILEMNHTEAITQENLAKSDAADTDEGNVSSNPKQESLIIDENKEEFVRKPEKKAPKHWSNLKKWILLQRFIRELEKVKKFNPKKPQILPLNPDPGAEKVNLRPQTVDERKNAEEWMLDYAIRQAVGQLAPTQKKKVALLVKAFETVAPTKEEPQVQYRTPRLKSKEPVFEGYPKGSSISLKSVYHDGDSVLGNENTKLEDPESAKVKLEKITADETEREPTSTPQDLSKNATVEGKTEESGSCIQMDNKNHIKMWHMIYQHVVSGIAEKVGSRLIDGSEDDEVESNDHYPNNLSYSTNDSSRKKHVAKGLTESDALELVKEAVDEILLPEIQDDPSDTQSERNCTEIGSSEESHAGEKSELAKGKNWRKLKNHILLKRSIKALEKARKVKPLPSHMFHRTTDPEREKIEVRRQMMDEKKKAEQWMLDYAVQHIVTKLTPARKKRVRMLVEAFEAVVPLPEM